ncbi:MAG: hypothetical protein Fur0042_26480 [Cyanophyceae cyanobacterium]
MAAFCVAIAAGCNAQPTATVAPVAAPTATPASAPVASPESTPSDDPAATDSGAGTLKALVDQTRAAVDANDGDQAAAKFEQFEAAWEDVEDPIKEKNPDAYEAIEDAIDAVKAELGDNLDQKKTLMALTDLAGAIDQVK